MGEILGEGLVTVPTPSSYESSPTSLIFQGSQAGTHSCSYWKVVMAMTAFPKMEEWVNQPHKSFP